MKRFVIIACFLVCAMIVPQQDELQAQNLQRQAAKILKRFKAEPNVREVHAAALKFALVGRGRIQSLLTRARGAGWLPEFRMRYNYNTDDDRSTSFPTPTSPILTVQSTDLDHRFEFRASWNLDELVFNRNELSVYRELKRLVELRTDILKEVTKLYYERRRLQVDLILRAPKSLLAMVRRKLRLQELSADLDALTGGFFSRRLKSAGIDPYK